MIYLDVLLLHNKVISHVDGFRSAWTDNAKLVQVLAYADDVCVVTETRSQVSRQLRICAEFAKWANLTFNAKKCAVLCSIYKKRQ